MLTLHFKKRKIFLPESFEELSGKQFIAISGILFSGGDLLRCQLKVLRILAGVSRLKFRFFNVEFVDRAREQVNWIFDPDLYRKVTKQLIENYKGLYGPISDFDNLRMAEFHFSEIFYRELMALQDQENSEVQTNEALEKIIAVLYRIPKKDYNKDQNKEGDIREKFNAHELERNALRIARWPAAVKEAIFLWYDACRQKLIEDNPLVFEEPEKKIDSQFETGMYGVMRALAGNKLGTVEKIEDMYVHTALMEIGLIREEERWLEEQIKADK